MLCQVYKSPRREEMYLYVGMQEDLQRVPRSLLDRFGEPEKVMLLNLQEGKKLARADAGEVRRSILEQGFFLQMPPSEGARGGNSNGRG